MKRTLAITIGLTVAFSLSTAAQTARPSRLKVFISVDMEGITNVVHVDQTTPGTAEYAAARKWMAEDVNAAVEGAFKAGATEVIVNDSHGSMRNINPDDLNPRAVLISGSPKPLSMMQGIDETCDAVLFVGYHAQAGTQNATLDHTISGSVVHGIRVNGVEMPELGLNAAIAGWYGVPVVFVSGDVAVCRQAKALLGNDIVTAPVKDGIGRQAARLVPEADARKAIRDRAAEAVRRAKQFKPYRLNPPYTFELEFFVSSQADMACLVPEVKRKDARTVTFTHDDYVKGFSLLRALIALAPPR